MKLVACGDFTLISKWCLPLAFASERVLKPSPNNRNAASALMIFLYQQPPCTIDSICRRTNVFQVAENRGIARLSHVRANRCSGTTLRVGVADVENLAVLLTSC